MCSVSRRLNTTTERIVFNTATCERVSHCGLMISCTKGNVPPVLELGEGSTDIHGALLLLFVGFFDTTTISLYWNSEGTVDICKLLIVFVLNLHYYHKLK